MDASPDGASVSSPRDVAAAFYEAFLAEDLVAASAFLDADVVLHVPGTHPLAGDHRGLDGVLNFILESQKIMGAGNEQVELIDILGGDRYAAAHCLVTATRPDRQPLRNLTVHLFRVANGLVAEAWFYDWNQVEVDQFWN